MTRWLRNGCPIGHIQERDIRAVRKAHDRSLESQFFPTGDAPNMPLPQNQLTTLARLGAVTRLKELDAERAAILKAFPDLRPGRASAPPATPTSGGRKKRRSRRGWTAAQRKAAGERMKKYWAKRKGAKK